MAVDNTMPSDRMQRRQDGTNVIPAGVSLRISGALRKKIVTIVTTSVLTTTTLTQAVHAGAHVVITTGTSLSLLRHRIKLPNSTTDTDGDEYHICVGFKGTPTSMGVVVKPGTTTNLFVGTGTAGKGWKSSTRGLVGSNIALQSDGAGNYYITGRGVGIAAASTSLVWRTTG